MKANKEYRHAQNPKEKEFYDKFLEQFSGEMALERIALQCDNRGNPHRYLTTAERRIIVSTIQWLGSPVGQSFLNDCGFYPIEDNFNIVD